MEVEMEMEIEIEVEVEVFYLCERNNASLPQQFTLTLLCLVSS